MLVLYDRRMRIDGAAAMISLERETSLRVEPGTRMEIACVSGVLWITQEGDLRDLFLERGESLELSSPRGRALVTALEPSLVRVVDVQTQPYARGMARALWARCRAQWVKWRGRPTAVIGPHPATVERT